jgi:hypothetical protein
LPSALLAPLIFDKLARNLRNLALLRTLSFVLQMWDIERSALVAAYFLFSWMLFCSLGLGGSLRTAENSMIPTREDYREPFGPTPH